MCVATTQNPSPRGFCSAAPPRVEVLDEATQPLSSKFNAPGDPAVHARLVAMFGKTFHILANTRARTGQMFSIDAAYSVALDGGADYVFHCQVPTISRASQPEPSSTHRNGGRNTMEIPLAPENRPPNT